MPQRAALFSVSSKAELLSVAGGLFSIYQRAYGSFAPRGHLAMAGDIFFLVVTDFFEGWGV